MNITYNKFLIVFALMVILGGIYVYFSNGSNVLAAPVSPDSSLTSSGTTDSTPTDINAQISEDTAFLSTLTTLTRLNIDTSLFKDPAFIALNDNTVILDPVVAGRPNPFAPISSNTTVVNAQIAPVVTNPATGITNKSAELNGATDNTNGVTSTYFEYGPTQALGKTTPPVKESLIGTFVTTINGLSSGTPYFYRADAKVSGVLHYGDIVPFTTN